ncbi:MAG: hypothetical protein FWH35_10775, partial [Treponema sp.]|nr:hypothetical protein [Treponema sp.]
MFENLLGQKTADLLIHDIKAGVLSPAMLFTGPEISGKGTAALELARIISCEEEGEKRALWNCKCSACARHRFLIHADLLCMGPKDFFQDISASGSALKNEINADCGIGNTPEGILFIRSVRKLLLRFNPVLWEDDPKTGKISSLVNSLEDDLDEFHSVKDKSLWQKLADGILKNANKLESEAISENIPVAQLRNAAYWGRLAPSGRGKVLVIENADRMQEEGKNSLLKLLEEPPGYLYIILTTSRQGSMLPTVLSRLRQYRFYSRDGSIEAEVIRRVFRYREYIIPEQTDPSSPSVSLGRGSLPEPAAEQGHLQVARRGSPPGDENPAGNTISSYLESFLPVSGSKLKS